MLGAPIWLALSVGLGTSLWASLGAEQSEDTMITAANRSRTESKTNEKL